jgi:uncharacterized MAPEG superfamily protein
MASSLVPSFLSTTNYSLYAIPAYYFLSVAPHAYALLLIQGATNGRWNNANPHGTSWKEEIGKTVPKATRQLFERAESAHRNCLENQPLFYVALALGNVTRLDVGTLNAFAAGFLAWRALYIAAYLGITDVKTSYLRSFIWITGASACSWIILKAGNVMASGALLAKSI